MTDSDDLKLQVTDSDDPRLVGVTPEVEKAGDVTLPRTGPRGSPSTLIAIPQTGPASFWEEFQETLKHKPAL